MLGEKIKQSRKELGLTQQEFAKKLGISRSNLSDIENGRNKAGNLKLLSKISELTKKPLSLFVENDTNFNFDIYEALDLGLTKLILGGLIDENNECITKESKSYLDKLIKLIIEAKKEELIK
ncbi:MULTISPECIES: helix-turn-helix domain-containing protein [Clostridium]|uniref:Helix-turn-helix domain-containing protein n=2 Tax=root TaxID=1 RepID=A0ABY6SVC0_9CLOT|nr:MULTISPECIES: helix-turn-helix transcriptional regulator [Clostridium]DAF94547.1 MAG TPA: Helix-turn-helix XRE-family like protein [Siphoviridae sp. ct3gT1]CAI3596434.1 Helix-turn-helix domain-containing protein [Clostridium neonatale]CAI3608426.1 Helix-turn-helix domain-containing protein [Clostridium neonatale]CAI3629829.1 Helix-turn-helix domain-containing protein [Clostridium neonatale]CAI3660212.1 Helix-turn-helix domain-containing protein [Clostridium neonatale]